MALDILSFRCYDISGIVTGILPGWAGAGFPALLRICAEFGAIPPNSALGRSDLAAAAFRGTASKGARPFSFALFAFLGRIGSGGGSNGRRAVQGMEEAARGRGLCMPTRCAALGLRKGRIPL